MVSPHFSDSYHCHCQWPLPSTYSQFSFQSLEILDPVNRRKITLGRLRQIPRTQTSLKPNSPEPAGAAQSEVTPLRAMAAQQLEHQVQSLSVPTSRYDSILSNILRYGNLANCQIWRRCGSRSHFTHSSQNRLDDPILSSGVKIRMHREANDLLRGG